MKKMKKDMKRFVAPHLLALIEDKKVNVSKDMPITLEVRNKLCLSLEKQKFNIFSAGVSTDDKGNPNDFLIEYVYKNKVILLEGKVVDRYQYIEVA